MINILQDGTHYVKEEVNLCNYNIIKSQSHIFTDVYKKRCCCLLKNYRFVQLYIESDPVIEK